MSELNVLDNDDAMKILKDAVNALRAIGVPCMLAPMSRSQGMSISLHAGSNVEASAAANVAATSPPYETPQMAAVATPAARIALPIWST